MSSPQEIAGRAASFVQANLGGRYESPAPYDANMRFALFHNRAEVGREMAIIVEVMLQNVAKPQILEVAAGTGLVTDQLAEVGVVTACDLSFPQIEYSQAQGRANGGYYIHDMNEPFPHPDASFEVVTTCAANRYFTSEGFEQFLSESMRVIKDGGLLILPVFLGDHLLWRFIAKNIKQPTTVKGISALLVEAGFKIELVISSQACINGKAPLLSPTYIVARKHNDDSELPEIKPETTCMLAETAKEYRGQLHAIRNAVPTESHGDDDISLIPRPNSQLLSQSVEGWKHYRPASDEESIKLGKMVTACKLHLESWLTLLKKNKNLVTDEQLTDYLLVRELIKFLLRLMEKEELYFKDYFPNFVSDADYKAQRVPLSGHPWRGLSTGLRQAGHLESR